jgi:hypothetical protein
MFTGKKDSIILYLDNDHMVSDSDTAATST